MRRDPDLLREIMLAIEAAEQPELLRLPLMVGFNRRHVRFHVRLLIEAGFVHAFPGLGKPDHEWLALSLAWRGYDYLELIRDPRIWRAVKSGTARASVWTLASLGSMARAAIIAKAQSLGIPMLP